MATRQEKAQAYAKLADDLRRFFDAEMRRLTPQERAELIRSADAVARVAHLTAWADPE